MSKPSLERMAAVAEACMGKGCAVADPQAAQAAIDTLKWAAKNEPALRLAVQIMNDDYVRDLLGAFPGAAVVSARKRPVGAADHAWHPDPEDYAE